MSSGSPRFWVIRVIQNAHASTSGYQNGRLLGENEESKECSQRQLQTRIKLLLVLTEWQ